MVFACSPGSGGRGSSCSPERQELRRFLPDRGVGGLRVGGSGVGGAAGVLLKYVKVTK